MRQQPTGHPSIVLVHAPQDQAFARQLAGFLEFGCDIRCNLEGGALAAGEHPVDFASGPSDEPLIVLLSKDSWPVRLPRERWDPVLFERPLAFVLLNPCPYPALLERGAFFDVCKTNAHRAIKRWLWHGPGGGVARYDWSADLEQLYTELADRSGILETEGRVAQRFAREAAGEFECVAWIPCHERSPTQVLGDLGQRLGLTLDGQEHQNLQRVQECLAIRRCLMVLDAPGEAMRSAFASNDWRSSILVTTAPVETLETPFTFEYARQLVKERRFAEAYELLYPLMSDPELTSCCAQELAWICEHWGRHEEAEWLRRFDVPPPTRQMGLFE